MAKTDTDRIQLQVVIDGSPARKDLASTTQEVVKLTEAQKGLLRQEKDLIAQRKAAAAAGNVQEVQRLQAALQQVRTEYGANSKALEGLRARQEDLRQQIGLTGMSLSELRKHAAGLRAALDKSVEGSERWNELDRELAQVETRMNEMRSATVRQLRAWEELRKGMTLDQMTGEQLQQEARYLDTMIQKLPQGSAQLTEYGQRLDLVNQLLRQRNTESGRSMAAWEEERQGMSLNAMSLQQLAMEQQRWEQIKASSDPNSSHYREAELAIEAVRERTEQLTNAQRLAAAAWEEERKGIALTEMSLEQLAREQKRYEDIRRTSKPDTEQYREATAGLAEVKDRLEQLNSESRQARDTWMSMRDSMHIDQMSIADLKMEKTVLEEMRATVSRTTPEFEKMSARLHQVDQALKESTSETARADREWAKARAGMRLADMTMQQLEQEVRRLKAELHGLDPNAPQFGVLNGQLRQTEARLKTLQTGLGPFGRMWAEVRSQVMGAGAVIGAMFAGGAIVNGFQGMVRSAAEYSDALADIRKTTGLSTPVVKALAKELGGIDTRTSRAELLALARDAGKLGLSAKADVLAFVKAGNQINVALGEDLGQDAIKNIGKLVDLFKLKEQFGLEDAMLRVGSAINELGMATTASEGYMVEFMKRLGGVAPIAGITVDQTLALGATLDSLGQTSEVSSTALSQMFMKMAGDAQQYAGIAGMSVKQFTDLMNRNALEAFMAVLDGSRKTEGGIVELVATLGDMGVEGSRASGVFAVLANNTDRLREQMAIANAAFQEGTSVTDEYAVKNENLAAQLEKLGKEFHKLFASNTVVGWLESLVNGTREAVDWMKRHRDAIVFIAKVLASATAAWVTYRLAGAAWARGAQVMLGLTRMMAVAKGVLSGSTMAAARAQIAFNNALKANPLGLILSALAMAISLFISFGEEVQAATDAQVKHNEALMESQRIAQNMSKLMSGSRAMDSMNRDQLVALRVALADQRKELDQHQAAAIAKEQDMSGAITEEHRRRAERIATIEAQLADEQDQKRRFDLQLQLEVLRSGYHEESQLRRITGQAITAESAESQKQLLDQQIAAVDARLKVVADGADAELRTVKWLNDEIKRLRELQEQQSADPATFSRYEREIKAREAELARITGEQAKKKRDKAGEDLQKMLEDYNRFQEELSIDRLSADEKEIAQLDQKHAEELAKVREQQAKLIAARQLSPIDANTDIGVLQDNQAAQRAALIEKQGAERVAAIREADAEISARLREGRVAHLQEQLAYYDEEIQLAQQRGQDTITLERTRLDILLKLSTTHAHNLILEEAGKWDQLIEEAKKRLAEYDAALQGMGEDPAASAERQLIADRIIALELAKSQAIEDINNARRQRERNERTKETMAERMEYARRIQNVALWADAVAGAVGGMVAIKDANIQMAESMADADGVRTDAEIANINRMKEERRRAALFHIQVQAAAAVASAVSSVMASPIPFPGNLLAAAPAIGTVLGLIAQAKALLAQTGDSQGSANGQTQQAVNPYPVGRRGGRIGRGRFVPAGADGGVLQGPSHENDGLAVINPRTGQQVAEFEGGEAYMLFSKAFTQANQDQLGMLMEASRRGMRLNLGGAPLARPNFDRVSQALSPSFGLGGFFPATGRSVGPTLSMDQTNALLQLIAAKLSPLDDIAHSTRAFPKELTARVKLGPDYDREMEQWSKLKSANSARRRG